MSEFDNVKVSPQVEKFKESIFKNAHDIVVSKMPEKIIQLDTLITNMPGFKSAKELSRSSETAAPNKKRKLDKNNDKDGEAVATIPYNKPITQTLNSVKEELLDMIELVNTVKIWIQLNIPRIEDGNNFGVGIQEEMVSELARAESDALTVIENMSKYYIHRAKLVAKTLKHPEIEDFRQSVIELDEKEFINLRLCAMDIRNNFAILYDMILKNLEKIKRPRSSNHVATLY